MAQLIQFPSRQEQKAIATWVEEFERDYFTRRARCPKSQTTWDIDYRNVFCKLPPHSPLTADILLKTVIGTQPETRTRKRYCIALNALAKFAGVAFDFKPYSGSYSPKKVQPRELPDDGTIVRVWFELPSLRSWRWVYGIIATYGLRPHEIFHIDYQRLQQGDVALQITGGKTGSRIVFPLYPEWFSQFDLTKVDLPECTGSANKDLGARVSRAFNRLEIPFPAYALRHCWAVRSLQFGLDLSLAAQQMGHSVQVHTETYHAWISEQQHRQAFERMQHQANRPQAPCDYM